MDLTAMDLSTGHLALGGLFVAAFLAATLIPATSEVVLAGLLVAGQHPPWVLLAVATMGNTLGSLVNWALGRWFAHFQGRSWYPLTAEQARRLEAWFAKYGLWALLLAWLPVVGDPLTVVAGVLRVGPVRFLIPVALGKAARYLVVWLIVSGLT